jgi:hypothetical protein
MKKKMRLDQYIKQFKDIELVDKTIEDEKPELTSPYSAMSDEELRVFLPYMHRQNVFLVTKNIPDRKKTLILRSFFRTKRNQVVTVKLNNSCLEKKLNSDHIQGKVSAIGRDFVLLTTIRKKIWIPYTNIKSANIPNGMPDYANNYQHVIYDNKLKDKLLKHFSNTVLNRDDLVQQFYEESLVTNLKKWVGIHVQVRSTSGLITGKLIEINEKFAVIKHFTRKKQVALSAINMIETVSLMYIFSSIFRKSTLKGGENFG